MYRPDFVRKTFISLAVLLCLLGNAVSMTAQSLRIEDMKKNFSKEEWFKASGGVKAEGSYYAANPNYGRPPWTYLLSANVNFKLFNLIDLPFSINLSNTGFTYAYPNMPNRFALHPSYKWITLHVGDISMTYSPYTLAGHQFTGAGIDLTPDHWQASVMFGRLQRAVEYNPENTSTTVPACYKRLGTGARLRYDHDVFYIGTNVLLAKDYEKSLAWKPDSLGIKPQQNLAMDFEAGVTIAECVKLSGEYAFSFLERDLRVAEHQSVNFYQAFKAGIHYNKDSYSVGIGYERIDPEYTSLGAYYFNNDLENYTADFAGAFLDGKMSLAVSVGVELNNLEEKWQDRDLRFIGSANWSWQPNESTSLSLNYSNFQTHQNVKSQFDYINQYDITENLDTLTFTQLSHNAGANASYRFSHGENQDHNLNFNASLQISTDNYNDSIPETGRNTMFNSGLSHSVNFKEQQLTLGSSLNYTYSQNIVDSHFFGPSLTLGIGFLEKTLQWNTSLSANAGMTNANFDRVIANARTTLAYTLLKHHKFSLSGVVQHQWRFTNTNTFNTNATLSYAYNF